MYFCAPCDRGQNAVPRTVRCDEKRLAQLLSNLLANAVEHGAARTPIQVAIKVEAETFTLDVANEGEPIPPEKLARLFEPYFRGGQSGRHNGLGLGLFIVAEIAKAHGGTVVATSGPEGTAFTFRMPVGG